MITFDHVTKTYPDGTTAVADLNLDIEEGSLTVFVGPSGCGKTTSMRMINKMITPTSGRVLVNGVDVTTVDPVPHRLGIGYVIQHAGLLPHRTVLDNVASVLRLKGVAKAEARARAHEAIERVRLRPELINRYPAQLSGGQQQRVGVARALAADPPILLMDEPFSAVDPVVRDELQQEMLRLQREIKKTIVLVTHDIDEALLLGDKIAVFAPGGVMQQYADAETVLTRPANPFVASMIGRDRGFRALTFRELGQVAVQPLPEPVHEGEIRVGHGWSLLLDLAGRPEAWMHDVERERIPVGTTVTPADNLRRALDGVLSSPAAQAAVVNETGVLTGLLSSAEVNRAIAAQNVDGTR